MELKKSTFVFLFALLTSISAIANSPIWENAKWIWQEEAGPANTWVAFRKEFNLKEIPKNALANIAVDTKYWLWVNGEMVLFEGGLARGAAPNTNYYDEVDLKSYLKKGENTIAILVWYWGRTRKVHDDSGKGGLLFYADFGQQVLKSDDTWKMKVHPAYDPKSGGGGGSANRVNAYNVKFDAQKSLGDWTDNAWYSNNYNDKNWDKPILKGVANGKPWGTLVKRAIPQWNDRGLVDYESLVLKSNKEKINLPFKNTTDSLLVISAKLPFNKQITPYLKVNSKAGKTIVADMENPFNMLKGTFITKDGVQEFESYSWINGHVVEYSIPAGVEVLALKYRWTGVGEMTGNFECSDPYFSRLWWMARNTLYVCARDGFMDCPDRERGLWIGDVADQTGAIFYSLDDAGKQLLKKGIDNTIAYRAGDTIQGLAPGFGAYRGKSSELTGQSLQFIDQVVWQYYYNTGDKKTLENAYPAILKYLKLWEMQSNGLPEHRKGYANWIDWGIDPDQVPVNVILYYMALNATKKMATTLDKEQDLEWLNPRIESIKANFENEYWQGNRYGSKDKVIEERTSALAMISGLAKKEHYNILVDSVLVPVRKSSPHMEWMAEEAIMLTGQYDKGLERMKVRYEEQVNMEWLTTLYEKFLPKLRGTYNHAWNAPNYVLSRYIAGIKPTSVAWKTFEVKPNLAHMTSVKQVVPSVKGDITMEVNKTASKYQLDLISPDKTTATVYIPKEDKAISKILVNGKEIWKKGKLKTKLKNLSLIDEDVDFISFEVEEGTWNFTAVYK
ncbi:alpha-L-rhamnosidase-related protein [Seonamhaeicola aphaedonensis]|uniref:Alpha-L-rhamnosidase-like protein n=1 Tax=Seonamhaeicola aphaedonensis TaxID=1461338 RepID=A0A3D9HEA5_9FLAO|nr:alpha-L-rhamnosidase C-terminal domain-containing protein [Seonamhaeicola aphaedonensis]RED47803.1 alpha-L-rhamnosidase-like protein [Seonamhaeicola aphaedonensis]